jgi:IclR family acetate operon transcriptional repressor
MSRLHRREKNDEQHLRFGDIERARDSATGRALAILHAISLSDGSVSATELAPRLALPKPTVHRLMLVLERIGYLQREASSKRFIAGPALAHLAMQTLTNSAQFSARRMILSDLADDIHETCHLTTLAGDLLVLVDSVDPDEERHSNGLAGSRYPLYCTASGKLFLSRMPAHKRRRLLTASPLEKLTPRTVVDPPVIEKELRRVRASQVGLEDNEFREGFVCVAVPVFDPTGRMCATVSTHASTKRRNLRQVMELVPALHQVSASITRTLTD